MKIRQSESGAVSLFIVIFTALLITTITVAFVRTMIQNQQQATASDLSKSALDSAQAGVEDAKRLIVYYRQHCMGTTLSTECQKLADLMKGDRCDTLQQAGISSGDKEVMIKQSEGDDVLQQAYTCVKVSLNTIDFIGSVASNASRIIPLDADGAFNQVTVEWYSQEDLQEALEHDGSGQVPKIDLYNGLEQSPSLPKLSNWPRTRPALLRAQLIQFNGDFALSDFDKTDDGKMNTASLFLMPSLAGSTTINFSDDFRQTQGSLNPEQVACNKNFSATSIDGQYACKVTINLPVAVNADDNVTRSRAYLRISEFYNVRTTFRITLGSATSGPVRFRGIQPIVDSTGRANDFFRRVSSRIELGSSVPYVENAVDITNNLCKAFLVTDTGYDAGDCTN